MKTIARRSNRSLANSDSSNEKEPTMKTIARRSNSHSLANSDSSNEKEPTMKTIARRSNSRSLANSDSNNIKAADNAILAKVAALLQKNGLSADSLFVDADGQSILAPKAPEKAPKADRLYELAIIGADFRKNRLYATPTSDNAAQYMAECKALCVDTLAAITAPIATDVRRIAERAESNGGETLKDDLIRLCDSWKIPAQSMRIIMQLCAPVVCACNGETDEIARRCYGMARANALMGSACNMLMYSKAASKESALPFKRVAHNLTALGLAFSSVASVEDCDFCVEGEAFGEVITLCDYWLNKCEKLEKAETNAAPEKAARRGRKAAPAPAPAPAAPAPADSAAILAQVKALLGIK